MNDPGSGHRVLVATDGSAAAGIGVELAASIIWPAASSIVVVEAVETGVGLYGGPLPALVFTQVDRIEAAIREEAARVVAEAAAQLARPGITVDTAVLAGRPAEAVVAYAREIGADLVIVGARGHGTIESMVLGSVSAEIVDRSPVPVLVARQPRLDGVVLAWDGSGCAARAAGLLERWPTFAGASVRVVSVADVEVPWWSGVPELGVAAAMPVYVEAVGEAVHHYEAIAAEMAAQLGAAGLSAVAEVRRGDAATELISAAAASKSGLIVMGTHGRTGLRRLVLGSVAHNVVRHAPCNVLVVRDDEDGA